MFSRWQRSNRLLTGDSPVTWADVRQLFGRREFRALVGVRVFGQLGDGMVQAALTTFVLFSPERQPTAAKIAIAFAILLLPYSVFGPFIGILIDRWPRQLILRWASLLRALSVVLVAAVVLRADDGGLLGVTVLVSLGIGRFLLATLSASLPHVVRDRELVTANAFAPTAGTMSSALGGLFGVGIERLGGPDFGVLLALTCSALLQITAAGVAGFIHRNHLGPESVVRGMREQLRRVAGELVAGAVHLRRQPAALRAMLVVVAHRSTFGLATVLVLVLLRFSFNLPNAADDALGQFAYTVAAAALGAFLGAVMAPVMVGQLGTRRWSVASLVIGAVTTGPMFAWVIADPTGGWALPAMLTGSAFLGWTGQSVKVCGDSVLQQAIDDDHRGRVFAIYDMAVNVGLVSGIVLAASFLSPDGRSLWAAGYITAGLALAPLLLRTPPSQ